MNLKPFAPAIVWGIFIFALSAWPSKDFPKFDWDDLMSLDKIVHIIFYALLTYLILRGIQFPVSNSKFQVGIVLAIAAFSASYGWFLEWFQEKFCQDRLYDVMDGIANTIGAFGVAVVYIIRFWLKKSTELW